MHTQLAGHAAHTAHAAPAVAEHGIAWAGAGLLVAVLVCYAALVLGALVSIARSAHGGGMKLVWVVFVFIAPFLGSLLWFLIGRHAVPRRPAAY